MVVDTDVVTGAVYRYERVLSVVPYDPTFVNVRDLAESEMVVMVAGVAALLLMVIATYMTEPAGGLKEVVVRV